MTQQPGSMSPNDYSNSDPYARYSSAPSQPSSYAYQARPAEAPMAGPPPSNAGWAVVTILFFWPLAFSAFTHVHNVYPFWAMGDQQGAQEASDRVKTLGKIALGIFVVFIVGFMVLYGILIAAAISAAGGAYN